MHEDQIDPKKLIIVKDRFPTISQVKNDCSIPCLNTFYGEPLNSILGRLCERINAASRTYLAKGINTTLSGDGTQTHPFIVDIADPIASISVGLTMPAGFSVSGSPVLGIGTLAVTTSLSGIIAGNGSGFIPVGVGPGLTYTPGLLSSNFSTSFLNTPSIGFTYDSGTGKISASVITQYIRNLFSSDAPITYNPTTGIFGTGLTQYTDKKAQDAIGNILESQEFIYDTITPKISIREISALKLTGTKPISFISDFPAQTGQAGKILATNGAGLSWVPDQTGSGAVPTDTVGVPDLNTLRAYDYYSTPSGTTERPSGTEKTVVNLLGRFTPGDGGGGLFYWDSASTATEDGGTVFKPTAISGAGRWIRIYSGSVNVKWFGAKSDGITDAKSSFDAALLASNSVFIPEGTYHISDTITISSPKIIHGIREKSIISVAADKDGLNIPIAGSESLLQNFTLQSESDISVPTMKTKLIGEGIHCRGILRMYGVRIQYFPSHGMNLIANLFLPTNHPDYGNTSNGSFELCSFYYNGGHGVYIGGDDASNCTFTSCDFRTNGRAGLYSHGFLGNHAAWCHSASNTARAGNKSTIKIGSTFYCLMDQMHSFVNHAGTSYRAILDSINIEPGVTSGWASYWVAVTTIPGLEDWSVGGSYIKQKKPGVDAGWEAFWAIMPSVEFNNPLYTPDWDDNAMYLNGGSYVENNGNGFGVYNGCYSEGGQAPNWFGGQNYMVGGDNAAGWWSPNGIINGHYTPEMLPQGGSMYFNGWTANGRTANGNYTMSMDAIGLGIKEGDAFTGIFWLKDIYEGGAVKVFRRQYANSVQYRTWDITTFYTDPSRFGRTLPFSPGQPNEQFAAKLVIPGEFHEDWGTSQAAHFSFGATAPTTGEWRVGDFRMYCGPDPNIMGFRCTVTGTPGTWVTVTITGALSDYVSTIAALQAYSGISKVLVNTDILRGGTFYYTTSVLTDDNGVIFAATGKGTGHWVRVFNKNEGINASWWGVVADGVTTGNTAKIQSAFTYANTNNIKRVKLSGNILLDSFAGTMFNLSQNGLEISGEGADKTTLTYPNVAINADSKMFSFTGESQSIHDLKIVFLPSSGTNDYNVIAVETGSFRSSIYNLEISGIFGTSTAGGACITTYQAWNQAEFTTTLGTTIASGAQTVTPASMAGIFIGRTLHVAGTAEEVRVTAFTQTTFTATFANAHNSTDVVTIYSQGRQYVSIKNCYLHDGWAGNAIITNSQHNLIQGCTIHGFGGNSSNQGAIYDQSGYTIIKDCNIRGSQWGIHGHKSNPSMDASGSQYLNNFFEDIIQWPVIFDNQNNSSQGWNNVAIPDLAPLDRFVLIQGNTFRNTAGNSSLAAISTLVPSRIIGNVFEDFYTTSNEAVQFDVGADLESSSYSVFSDNTFRLVNALPAGKVIKPLLIKANCNGIVVSNNQFIGDSKIVGDNTRWVNNVTRDGKLMIDANNATVSGNTSINATSDAYAHISANTKSGITLENNRLISSSTAKFGTFDFTNQTNWMIRGNSFPGVNNYFRYLVPNSTIELVGNQGGVSYNGNTVLEQTFSCGRLLMYPFGASASIAAGQVLKLSAGVLVKVTTADTVFDAIATSTLPAGAANAYVVGQVGAIARVNTTGAWTIGNYAIISTSSAGTLKDGGATQPRSNYSFGRFLDSGGGTGVATVMIMQIRTTTPVIFENYQDAPNTTTVETDIFPNTLIANTFANDGEKVLADYSGVTVAHATATRQIRAYFGGTLVYDSTAIATTAIAHWSVHMKLIRSGSSSVRVSVNFKLNSGGTNLRDETTYTEVTGLTLTATQVIKLTGTAAATGAATNDIVGKASQGFWYPSVSVAV